MSNFAKFLNRIANPPSLYGRLTWDGQDYAFSPARNFATVEEAQIFLAGLTEAEQSQVIVEVLYHGPRRPVRVMIYPRGDIEGVVRLGLGTARLRQLDAQIPPEIGVQDDPNLT